MTDGLHPQSGRPSGPQTVAGWEALTAGFGALLDAPDEAARQAVLADLRKRDPRLAAEAEALWKAHLEDDGPLDRPLGAEELTKLIGNGAPVRAPELTAGAVVGEYKVVRELGRGAFATVYVAEDLVLGRAVALKVSVGKGGEARTLAVLEHDHVVGVYAEHTDERLGARIIAMQLVNGASLRAAMKALGPARDPRMTGAKLLAAADAATLAPAPFDPVRARERSELEALPLPRAVAVLGGRLAGALAHAHRLGILHLDVKPENILLDQYGRPFLADFNVSLARAGGVVDPEAAKSLGGTIGYMAPEQSAVLASGGKNVASLTPAADIYGLGVVLRELLDGVRPAGSAVGKVASSAGAAMGADPEAAELRALLDRCLATKPEDRWNDADALRAALEGFGKVQQLRDELPTPGFVTRLSSKGLFPALLVFIVGPQLIGSAVNIAYNATRIVRRLDPHQVEAFAGSLGWFNALIYGLAVGAFCYYVAPMMRHFGWWRPMSEAKAGGDAGTRATLRRRALGLPKMTTGVTTFGWTAGAIFFPATIHWGAAPLSSTTWGHFGVSFLFSWLVAHTYSVLYAYWLALRVLYPTLLAGEAEPATTARREVKTHGRVVYALALLAGLIPLLAAALLIGGGDALMEASAPGYRALLLSLLASGSIGFVIAVRAVSCINRAIAVLKGETQVEG
jgi:serine/threonine protein kinase